MSQLFSEVDQRQRNLRIVLFVIILATLPFYCAGFLLWGTAPARNIGPIGGTATATTTLRPDEPTITRTIEASITPLGGGDLPPTPIQFTPATAILPATSTTPPIFIPTSTTAPTLTPFPSSTPIPLPTNTSIPIPTSTPFPTNTLFPTITPTPTLTETTIPIDLGAGGDSGVPSGGSEIIVP